MNRPSRPDPDGATVVQVRLMPIQEEPGPFTTPEWTDAARAIVFGKGRTISRGELAPTSGESDEQEQVKNRQDKNL
jgi:hypothetical protein